MKLTGSDVRCHHASRVARSTSVIGSVHNGKAYCFYELLCGWRKCQHCMCKSTKVAVESGSIHARHNSTGLRLCSRSKLEGEPSPSCSVQSICDDATASIVWPIGVSTKIRAVTCAVSNVRRHSMTDLATYRAIAASMKPQPPTGPSMWCAAIWHEHAYPGVHDSSEEQDKITC